MSYICQWSFPTLLKLLPYGIFILGANTLLDYWRGVPDFPDVLWVGSFTPALLSLVKHCVSLSLVPCFIYALLKVALRTWVMVKRVFLYQSSTFHKTNKYGPAKTTWAVVTGATDGIGWSFCENLAKQRYNIVLVSRNIEKLTDRSA
jgi:17beta-estradiol 17-dehydrogenase / very-long-chain 3-oxoacyl-CoA reductase